MRLVRPAASLLAVTLVGALLAPAAGAASRRQVVTQGAAYAADHGYHVGIAVLDTRTGHFYGSGDYRGTFASESVVKVFIATRLLVTGQMHGGTRRAAYKMITQSDDSIASSLYPRVGGDHLINWVKAHYRVPNLGTPPNRAGWWGNTHIVPEGLVRLYAKLKRDPKVGPWLLHAMHHATPYGSDGTYQFFGIPSATTHAAIKQGWGDDYDDWSMSADFNTTGFVNHDRYAMAVLARGPIGTYGTAIGDLLTTVARRLMPGGVFPDAPPSLARMSIRSGSTRGGDRLILHGANLTHVRQVWFGRTPAARLRVLGRRTVAVRTPAHRHSLVGVRIVTDHGATRLRAFRYVQPPVLLGLARHDGSIQGRHRVLLRGSSFKAVHQVLFGSVPARSVHVRGPHTIAVVVPPHAAGAVDVRVVGRYGESPLRGPGTSYRYHAPPTVTALSASSGPTAGGEQLHLTGSGFGPRTVVLFGAVRGTDVHATAGGHGLVVTVPAHRAGTFAVRVQTAWGRSAKSKADRYTFTG